MYKSVYEEINVLRRRQIDIIQADKLEEKNVFLLQKKISGFPLKCLLDLRFSVQISY